jgi:hypothetical protein
LLDGLIEIIANYVKFIACPSFTPKPLIGLRLLFSQSIITRFVFAIKIYSFQNFAVDIYSPRNFPITLSKKPSFWSMFGVIF